MRLYEITVSGAGARASSELARIDIMVEGIRVPRDMLLHI
jgi:hypothetical protein